MRGGRPPRHSSRVTSACAGTCEERLYRRHGEGTRDERTACLASQVALLGHLLDDCHLVPLGEVAVALHHRHGAVAEHVGDLEQTRTLARQVRGTGMAQVVETKPLNAGGSERRVPMSVEPLVRPIVP